MRTTAAFALVLGAMMFTVPAAHAQLATARLVGLWKIDKKMSVAAMKKQGNMEHVEDIADTDISIQFQNKGRFQVISEGEIETRGKWRALREIAKKGKLPQLEIEIIPDDDDDKQKALVKYLDKNTIEMTLHDSDEKIVLVFKRSVVKPKKQ